MTERVTTASNTADWATHHTTGDATMFYRIANADVLGTETGQQWEGLFTAQEVEQIREKYYSHNNLTDLLVAEPACNNCDDCQLRGVCNK